MKDKLRIVQIINVRWFNATAWYGLKLSKLLKDAGHDVLVLGLPGTESFEKAKEMGLHPLGLDLNSHKPHKATLGFLKLANIIRKFKPDIVNCHRGEGFVFLGILKVLGHSFKLVRTRGDQRAPRGGQINSFLHARVADAVIASNSATERQIKKILAVPEDKLFCVLGGVDKKTYAYTEEGRHKIREELGVKPDEKLVGLLGRFDEVKGQMEMIYAMAQVKRKIPKARLMLAGFPKGTSQQMVDKWARDSHMDDTVFPGYCDDVAACISAMDLGVVASLGSEAIARAALEIMSCGVPLVGTRVGAMPDLLADEYLVPPGRVGALARLIERVLAEGEERQALQDYCLERIKSLDDEHFLKASLDIYKKIIK